MEVILRLRKKKQERTTFVFSRLTILPVCIRKELQKVPAQMLGKWARQRRAKERHWQDGSLSQNKEKIFLRKWSFLTTNQVALKTLLLKIN